MKKITLTIAALFLASGLQLSAAPSPSPQGNKVLKEAKSINKSSNDGARSRNSEGAAAKASEGFDKSSSGKNSGKEVTVTKITNVQATEMKVEE